MRIPAKVIVVGKSVEAREITAVEIGPRSAPCVLLLGGFHGDEPKSVRLVEAWEKMLGSPTEREQREAARRNGIRWIILPVVNPDGFSRRRRRNANGVDLNRNFPTRNWSGSPHDRGGAIARVSRRSRMYGGPHPGSEPETQAIIHLIERSRPACIITVHSISGGRYCDNYDGPARRLANAIARCNGYPVAATIGYSTPGSFGTWAGVERKIPTLTLELPAEHSTKLCLSDNRSVLAAVARIALRSSDRDHKPVESS